MPITAERRAKAFADALTFQDFVDSMQVNRELFEGNYAAYQLSAEDKTFFADLPETVDVLVLAHDWCGDVVANTPLFGKIEAETGKLRLHLLLRDPDNQDIANEYLHADGRNHIPTYIFYNQAGEELGVFIERTDDLSVALKGWVKAFYNNNPQYEEYRGKGIGELPAEVKNSLLPYIKAERAKVTAQEQASILALIKPIVNKVALVGVA
jgi:Thioredoxin